MQSAMVAKKDDTNRIRPKIHRPQGCVYVYSVEHVLCVSVLQSGQ